MADVSIDASVSTGTARGMRSVVFTAADIGYWFFIDGSNDLSYSKTTDGGATWGAAIELGDGGSQTHVAFDVWYDQWTPGDTGTLIHFWWFGSSQDDVKYKTLDTADDSLGTSVIIFAGSTAVAGRGVFVSGTKTRSGYLYCAYDIDAGAERGFHRSTNGGSVWSANLSTTFVEATIDQCLLFPASNTGDNNDCWAVYHDASVDALTLKMWDSSAGSATESTTIATMPENTTDLTGQYGFSGAIRHSDGHLILAVVTERDVGTSDHRVFNITSIATRAELTAITTNIDDHYYPAVFIDQDTDDIYVAFNGLRTGGETLGTSSKVYYTTSSDGGTNWSAGSTAYMEGAAAAVFQVWAPLSGPRFYVGWRVGTTLIGNAVNSVSFGEAPPSDAVGTDSATISDTATAAGLPVGVDTATLSEPSAVALLTGQASDLFSLSEAAIAQLVGQDLVAVDTITLSEDAVVAVLAAGVDSATLTDTLTDLAASLALSEGVAFSDVLTSLPVTIVAVDSATVTDLAALTSGNDSSAADAFTLSESAVAAIVAVAADALTVTETSTTEGLASLVDAFLLSESSDTGGTVLTGIAGVASFGLTPRLTINAAAGADTGITWGNTDVLMGTELLTFGANYVGDLPSETGVSPVLSAEVELGV